MEQLLNPQKADAIRWYREPWNLLVLGGPLVVVCASMATAVLAYRGADKVVAEDYYRQGLAINKDIDRDRVAAERKIVADLRWDAASNALALDVRGAGKMPASLIVTLADRSGNGVSETVHRVVLKQAADGAYRGMLSSDANDSPSLGGQVVYVKVEAADWRLTEEWRNPAGTALRMKAAK